MKKYKNFTKWLESKHLYHYWLENDKLGVEHRINPESKILQDNTFRFYIDSKGVGTYYPNSWFKENIGGLNIKFNLENETYNIGYEKIQLNPNDDSIDFFFHEYVGEVELKDFYKTLVDLLSKKIVNFDPRKALLNGMFIKNMPVRIKDEYFIDISPYSIESEYARKNHLTNGFLYSSGVNYEKSVGTSSVNITLKDRGFNKLVVPIQFIDMDFYKKNNDG